MDFKENITENGVSVYCICENTLSISECSLIETTNPFGNECTCLYFNRVSVHPTVRDKGVGTKLVKRMLKLVDEFGLPLCCDINSYGDLDYDALYNWYLSLGFKSYEKYFKNIIFTQLWYNIDIKT